MVSTSFPSGGAVSISVPRLADFSYDNTASLISPVVLRGVYALFEGVLVFAAGVLIALAYVDEPTLLHSTGYWTAHLALGLFTVIAFELAGLYGIPELTAPLRNIPRLLVAWTAAFTALVAAVFFLKLGTEFSRVWAATWYATGTAGLIGSRLVMSGYLRRLAVQGRLYRRAAIYGTGNVTSELIAQLEADISGDIRICGIFDDRDEPRTNEPRAPLIAGYPRLGGIDDLVAFGRSTRIDLIVVALPITAEERVAAVMKSLSVLPAEIKIPARATKLRFTPGTYSHVGAVAMIDLYDKPINDWGTVSKWLFDKIVGTTALVLLSPLMLAIAVAIRRDSPGPALFRQKRYGFNNELIEIYKFRSMYADCADANAEKLVSRDDDRVTRLGRFLRKTSLDELPQLINVVKGDLSLVGPRPHALKAKAGSKLYDEVVDGYYARHKVKPGITGWAQINGWRGETDTADKIQQRVLHDLYYIENWSLFLDIYILLKTPWALIARRENAY